MQFIENSVTNGTIRARQYTNSSCYQKSRFQIRCEIPLQMLKVIYTSAMGLLLSIIFLSAHHGARKLVDTLHVITIAFTFEWCFPELNDHQLKRLALYQLS